MVHQRRSAGLRSLLGNRGATVAAIIIVAGVGLAAVGWVRISPLTSADPSVAASSSTDVAGALPVPSGSGVSSAAASASAKPSPKHTAGPPGTGGGTSRLGCKPSPHLCGYPDATNTGYPPGTAFTTISGDYTVSKAGTVS